MRGSRSGHCSHSSATSEPDERNGETPSYGKRVVEVLDTTQHLTDDDYEEEKKDNPLLHEAPCSHPRRAPRERYDDSSMGTLFQTSSHTPYQSTSRSFHTAAPSTASFNASVSSSSVSNPSSTFAFSPPGYSLGIYEPHSRGGRGGGEEEEEEEDGEDGWRRTAATSVEGQERMTNITNHHSLSHFSSSSPSNMISARNRRATRQDDGKRSHDAASSSASLFPQKMSVNLLLEKMYPNRVRRVTEECREKNSMSNHNNNNNNGGGGGEGLWKHCKNGSGIFPYEGAHYSHYRNHYPYQGEKNEEEERGEEVEEKRERKRMMMMMEKPQGRGGAALKEEEERGEKHTKREEKEWEGEDASQDEKLTGEKGVSNEGGIRDSAQQQHQEQGVEHEEEEKYERWKNKMLSTRRSDWGGREKWHVIEDKAAHLREAPPPSTQRGERTRHPMGSAPLWRTQEKGNRNHSNHHQSNNGGDSGRRGSRRRRLRSEPLECQIIRHDSVVGTPAGAMMRMLKHQTTTTSKKNNRAASMFEHEKRYLEGLQSAATAIYRRTDTHNKKNQNPEGGTFTFVSTTASDDVDEEDDDEGKRERERIKRKRMSPVHRQRNSYEEEEKEDMPHTSFPSSIPCTSVPLEYGNDEVSGSFSSSCSSTLPLHQRKKEKQGGGGKGEDNLSQHHSNTPTFPSFPSSRSLSFRTVSSSMDLAMPPPDQASSPTSCPSSPTDTGKTEASYTRGPPESTIVDSTVSVSFSKDGNAITRGIADDVVAGAPFDSFPSSSFLRKMKEHEEGESSEGDPLGMTKSIHRRSTLRGEGPSASRYSFGRSSSMDGKEEKEEEIDANGRGEGSPHSLEESPPIRLPSFVKDPMTQKENAEKVDTKNTNNITTQIKGQDGASISNTAMREAVAEGIDHPLHLVHEEKTTSGRNRAPPHPVHPAPSSSSLPPPPSAPSTVDPLSVPSPLSPSFSSHGEIRTSILSLDKRIGLVGSTATTTAVYSHYADENNEDDGGGFPCILRVQERAAEGEDHRTIDPSSSSSSPPYGSKKNSFSRYASFTSSVVLGTATAAEGEVKRGPQWTPSQPPSTPQEKKKQQQQERGKNPPRHHEEQEEEHKRRKSRNKQPMLHRNISNRTATGGAALSRGKQYGVKMPVKGMGERGRGRKELSKNSERFLGDRKGASKTSSGHGAAGKRTPFSLLPKNTTTIATSSSGSRNTSHTKGKGGASTSGGGSFLSFSVPSTDQKVKFPASSSSSYFYSPPIRKVSPYQFRSSSFRPPPPALASSSSSSPSTSVGHSLKNHPYPSNSCPPPPPPAVCCSFSSVIRIYPSSDDFASSSYPLTLSSSSSSLFSPYFPCSFLGGNKKDSAGEKMSIQREKLAHYLLPYPQKPMEGRRGRPQRRKVDVTSPVGFQAPQRAGSDEGGKKRRNIHTPTKEKEKRMSSSPSASSRGRSHQSQERIHAEDAGKRRDGTVLGGTRLNHDERSRNNHSDNKEEEEQEGYDDEDAVDNEEGTRVGRKPKKTTSCHVTAKCENEPHEDFTGRSRSSRNSGDRGGNGDGSLCRGSDETWGTRSRTRVSTSPLFIRSFSISHDSDQEIHALFCSRASRKRRNTRTPCSASSPPPATKSRRRSRSCNSSSGRETPTRMVTPTMSMMMKEYKQKQDLLSLWREEHYFKQEEIRWVKAQIASIQRRGKVLRQNMILEESQHRRRTQLLRELAKEKARRRRLLNILFQSQQYVREYQLERSAQLEKEVKFCASEYHSCIFTNKIESSFANGQLRARVGLRKMIHFLQKEAVAKAREIARVRVERRALKGSQSPPFSPSLSGQRRMMDSEKDGESAENQNREERLDRTAPHNHLEEEVAGRGGRGVAESRKGAEEMGKAKGKRERHGPSRRVEKASEAQDSSTLINIVMKASSRRGSTGSSEVRFKEHASCSSFGSGDEVQIRAEKPAVPALYPGFHLTRDGAWNTKRSSVAPTQKHTPRDMEEEEKEKESEKMFFFLSEELRRNDVLERDLYQQISGAQQRIEQKLDEIELLSEKLHQRLRYEELRALTLPQSGEESGKTGGKGGRKHSGVGAGRNNTGGGRQGILAPSSSLMYDTQAGHPHASNEHGGPQPTPPTDPPPDHPLGHWRRLEHQQDPSSIEHEFTNGDRSRSGGGNRPDASDMYGGFAYPVARPNSLQPLSPFPHPPSGGGSGRKIVTLLSPHSESRDERAGLTFLTEV